MSYLERISACLTDQRSIKMVYNGFEWISVRKIEGERKCDDPLVLEEAIHECYGILYTEL